MPVFKPRWLHLVQSMAPSKPNDNHFSLCTDLPFVPGALLSSALCSYFLLSTVLPPPAPLTLLLLSDMQVDCCKHEQHRDSQARDVCLKGSCRINGSIVQLRMLGG